MTREFEGQQTQVPFSLVFEQVPMLVALTRAMARSILPKGWVAPPSKSFVPVSAIIAAPSDKLVSCYVNWCGGGERYADVLPPHLFSHWGLPLATRVIEQTGCELASIVNYGVTMKVKGELPRGAPLHLTASIKSFKKSETLARITVDIVTGTAHQPDAVVATLHLLCMLSIRRGDSTRSDKVQPQWSTTGRWRTVSNDGLKFALLTGDFNPIHWLGMAGRRSPFGQTVLQGMGMFARSYECLADMSSIEQIDVRFLKPVPLPSAELDVQHTAKDNEGWRSVRLVSDGKCIHMAGRYR